jgi:hypothetical protein
VNGTSIEVTVNATTTKAIPYYVTPESAAIDGSLYVVPILPPARRASKLDRMAASRCD